MIAQPLPVTCLSVNQYARIMQINPAHFWGAYSTSEWMVSSSCASIWPQNQWQHGDQVSRYDVALAIAQAEEQIANYVGYWPGPKWICQEIQHYPQFYRPDYVDARLSNLRGLNKGVKARWGKLFAVGQRSVTLIDTPTVAGGGITYSDESGYGAFDTATIVITLTAEQLAASANVCEYKVYTQGKSGAQEWEIREAREASISGSTLTLVFDAWLFIDPDVWATPPNSTDDRWRGVDIASDADFVTSVDVYREYADTTTRQSQFFWESENDALLPFAGGGCPSCGGTGCVACSYTTQDGCLHWRDAEINYLVPTPATYDASTETWISATPTVCRAPDMVKIWYRAGDVSEQYKCGESCVPMPADWQKVIAYLATARLERRFCDCANIASVSAQLQTDIAFSGEDTSYVVDFAMLANPFGTKKGEIMAWQYVSKFNKKQFEAYAI